MSCVQVRRLDGLEETRFQIASSELSPPPEGVDRDLGIIVEGDHCPTFNG